MSIMDALNQVDPKAYEAIEHELQRQRTKLELIASENIVSRAVMEAQGSVLTNKYAGKYGGVLCAPAAGRHNSRHESDGWGTSDARQSC